MPPLAHREAVVQKLLAVGEELILAFGCRVPLLYGDDESLRLVHEQRDAVDEHLEKQQTHDLDFLRERHAGRALRLIEIAAQQLVLAQEAREPRRHLRGDEGRDQEEQQARDQRQDQAGEAEQQAHDDDARGDGRGDV